MSLSEYPVAHRESWEGEFYLMLLAMYLQAVE